MKLRVFLLFSIVGLAGVAAGLAFLRAAPGQRPVAPEPSLALPAAPLPPDLSGEVSQLRAQLLSLEQRLAAPPAQTVPIANPVTPPARTDSAPASLPVHADQVAGPVQRLEDQLGREAIDPRWGEELSDQARIALRTHAQGATLSDVHCGATLCRLSVTHETLEQQRELATSLGQASPFNEGTVFKYEAAAEPPRTELYVTRKGVELADLTKKESAR